MDTIPIETGSGPTEQNQNQNTPPRDLAELEAIVEKGLRTYQDVGDTLDEIHSRRLYKPKYKNFRTYLKERWNLSRAHGYRIIAAAKLAKMSPIGDKPGNEHAARKRLASQKGKTKPKKTSKVIPEVEFETFTNLIARWEKGLDKADYSGLLKRVELYVDSLLCDRAAEEMAVAA